MCHVFTSRRAFALLQPGADSLVYSTIGLRSVLHCSCWSIWFVSGHARGVLPTLSGSCDPFAGSSRHAEPFLLSFTVITAASVTSPSLSLSHSCFLLMSIPLNIVITHLETHRGHKKGYTLAGKQLLTLERNLCVFNTHTHTPPHQTPHPPLPRCRPIHCQEAPSGLVWSASTVLSWCRHCHGRRWGGRECGLQRSGGWGLLLSSAAVWPVSNSAGPRPGEVHHDHYAVPVGNEENAILLAHGVNTK